MRSLHPKGWAFPGSGVLMARGHMHPARRKCPPGCLGAPRNVFALKPHFFLYGFVVRVAVGTQNIYKQAWVHQIQPRMVIFPCCHWFLMDPTHPERCLSVVVSRLTHSGILYFSVSPSLRTFCVMLPLHFPEVWIQSEPLKSLWIPLELETQLESNNPTGILWICCNLIESDFRLNDLIMILNWSLCPEHCPAILLTEFKGTWIISLNFHQAQGVSELTPLHLQGFS